MFPNLPRFMAQSRLRNAHLEQLFRIAVMDGFELRLLQVEVTDAITSRRDRSERRIRCKHDIACTEKIETARQSARFPEQCCIRVEHVEVFDQRTLQRGQNA